METNRHFTYTTALTTSILVALTLCFGGCGSDDLDSLDILEMHDVVLDNSGACTDASACLSDSVPVLEGDEQLPELVFHPDALDTNDEPEESVADCSDEACDEETSPPALVDGESDCADDESCDEETPRPTLRDGNPDCADLGLESVEFKIEPPESGTYDVDEDNVVTIAVDDGTYFDFDSSLPVIAVIVKGSNAANVYSFDANAHGGSELHAPINDNTDRPHEISHITFCL